jgi:transketolase N-terminal domain/subunit
VRFLLRNGPGPLARYAVLAVHGYLPEQESASFRVRGSRLSGHPEDHRRVGGLDAASIRGHLRRSIGD